MSESLPAMSLDDVLVTHRLAERTASQIQQGATKTPSLQAENQALHLLARQLAEQSQTMLKTLVTVAKDLCRAGTAGVSLLDVAPDGAECFRWEALAGALERYEGGTTPRNFSPCGVSLDRQAPQLYSYPERYFAYFQAATPTIVEGLVIPLMNATQPLGAIWVVSHDETRQFNAEDLQILTSLADFTAAALQSIHLRQRAEMALQQEQAARREAEVTRQALDEGKIKRQQAEAALRESESRFRLIVESAKEYAIFTLDLKGLITSWNSGAERLLGYTEAEIVGQPSYIIFTPEDRETGQAQQELQKAVAEGRVEDNRWHLRKNGSRFFASGDMMQLHDEAGNLQGLVKILRDITEAHQATERDQFLSQAGAVLAGTLDYKTTLFNIARLAVPFLADFCFFDILNVHQQIERVAWHHNDPAKWDWFEQLQRYTPPQDRQNHPITKVLLSGQANLVSYVTDAWMQSIAIDPDHLQFIQACEVRSLLTVPLIAHGRTLGALTVCLTTNSKRHYTQTDLMLAEELGRRAALALDNAQLYQQAQESNRLKDEFMSVLSHELRSPLNPILGWLQLVRKGNLSETQRMKAWATIERNAKLQAQLVEDLLDVSRILRGKLNLRPVPVHLVTTIQAAIDTIQLAAQAKLIDVQFTIGAVECFDHQNPTATTQYPELQVLGDPTRLQQVVWNLLSNAVKFTPARGRVEVQLEPVEGKQVDEWVSERGDETLPTHRPAASPRYAQITVTDTGVGIEPNFLPYVFDYFRQSDRATTRRFGGLGLGLAIVRQLVEAHGGTVEVESLGEGQGATFTVKLPLIPVAPKQEPGRNIIENDFNLEGIHVLAVDNEPDSLEFITAVLEQAGANVTTATSAAEALELLIQYQPDLLLSDIGMPEIGGYTLLQQVRRLEAAQHELPTLEQAEPMPAIALTAYAGDPNYQQAIAAGFQCHIAKPVEPETLIQAIFDLIKQNRS